MSSHFYSLDDDDDGVAGPSSHQQGLASSPSSHSASQQRGDVPDSSRNPIYALLDEEQGRTSRDRVSAGAAGIGGESSRRNGSSTAPAIEEVPLKQLQRAWVCERGCPELLPWKGDAVDDVCSQIEEQMTIVESLASDTSTAEEEHVRLGLVEIDVERARWLLKSYLRCRLDKIERHASFMQRDSGQRAKMSDLEKGYCTKYAEIQSHHYQSSVLDFLPANLRSLEDKAESGINGRGDMVTQPDLHSPVFIRCLEDCGQYTFRGNEDIVPFSKGSIHFVRYQTVRQLIERNQVEVL